MVRRGRCAHNCHHGLWVSSMILPITFITVPMLYAGLLQFTFPRFPDVLIYRPPRMERTDSWVYLGMCLANVFGQVHIQLGNYRYPRTCRHTVINMRGCHSREEIMTARSLSSLSFTHVSVLLNSENVIHTFYLWLILCVFFFLLHSAVVPTCLMFLTDRQEQQYHCHGGPQWND